MMTIHPSRPLSGSTAHEEKPLMNQSEEGWAIWQMRKEHHSFVPRAFSLRCWVFRYYHNRDTHFSNSRPKRLFPAISQFSYERGDGAEGSALFELFPLLLYPLVVTVELQTPDSWCVRVFVPYFFRERERERRTLSLRQGLTAVPHSDGWPGLLLYTCFGFPPHRIFVRFQLIRGFLGKAFFSLSLVSKQKKK